MTSPSARHVATEFAVFCGFRREHLADDLSVACDNFAVTGEVAGARRVLASELYDAVTRRGDTRRYVRRAVRNYFRWRGQVAIRDVFNALPESVHFGLSDAMVVEMALRGRP